MNPDNKKLIDVKTSISVIFDQENGIDIRFEKRLKKEGIETIKDLCSHTEEELRGIKQIADYAIGKITAFLTAHGLTLAMTEEQLSAYAEEFDAFIPKEEEAGASDKEPIDDGSKTEEESAETILMQMFEKVAETAEAKANERRRYELALDIFLNESDGFVTTEERAASAVSKADIFLSVYNRK